MRFSIFVTLLLFALTAKGQEYRLVYDANDMPELSNSARLYIEARQPDGSYRQVKSGYRIRTADALVKGNNSIYYSTAALYKNGGVFNCTLQINGRDIPLTVSMPILTGIRINLYTDSIKPVLNYYVNVEGTYSNGRVLPLDTSLVQVTASNGSMAGMEWVIPKKRPIPYDRVHFTATCLYNSSLQATASAYIKKLATD